MGIKEDAAAVLMYLAAYQKEVGDQRKGRHSLAGKHLSGEMKLEPARLNDAVKYLEDSGLVDARRFIGTSPYSFGTVELNTHGRVKAEEMTSRSVETVVRVGRQRTFEEWRDVLQPLVDGFERLGRERVAETTYDARNSLVGRVEDLMAAMRSPSAHPNPAKQRRDDLVGLLKTIEKRTKDIEAESKAEGVWTQASALSSRLQMLMDLMSQIYSLDAPTQAPASAASNPVPAPSERRLDGGAERWRSLRALPGGGQGSIEVVIDTERGGLGVRKKPKFTLEDSRRADLSEDEARRIQKRKARLRREFQILERLSKLRHPCIVRLLDGVDDPDMPWLVTEFAPYGTLHDHRGLMKGDVSRALRLTRDLASALQAAHDEKTVHRDVKPKNVLLFGPDRVALTDFGIAHDADATEMTEQDEPVGSHCFSPPEREHDGEEPTPAFDVYSLGKILYFMLSGGVCPPREDHSRAERRLAVVLERDELVVVDELLDQMIARERSARIPIEAVIARIDRIATRLSRPMGGNCRLCRAGNYREAGSLVLAGLDTLQLKSGDHSWPLSSFEPATLVCDNCGSLEIVLRQRGGLVSRPLALL